MPEAHFFKHFAHLARRALFAVYEAVQQGRVHFPVGLLPSILDQYPANIHNLCPIAPGTFGADMFVENTRRQLRERKPIP